VERPYARVAALLLLFGLVCVGAAPCLCPAQPTAAADHCGGGPLPGVRAGHDACACPCMTSAPAAAERPDVEVRTTSASVPESVPARVPRSVVTPAEPRPADTSPPPPLAPPTVLRI
jgi:hypothetical protein